jgi:hypothetical protein
MSYRTLSRVIVLTGDAGAASGSATFGVLACKLQGIQVQYHEQPVTTDVEVTSKLNGLEKLILTLTDNNDDLPLQAVGESVLDDLGALTSILIPPRLAGEVIVKVSQGDPDPKGVTVILLVK